jgi:hypothetical protein
MFIKFLFLFAISLNLAFGISRPNWIDDTNEICSNNEICAVGSGKSLSIAKSDARNNILKVFEVNINSNFNSSITADTNSIKKYDNENLEETTDGILKGVKIEKSYNNDKEYYVLAVLNKNIAKKEIKTDIDNLDSKMKLLLAENNIKYNSQLENLYIQRSELNKKYLVVAERMLPEIVKYNDIFKNKKITSNKAGTFYIKSTKNDILNLKKIISAEISNNGGKIINDEQKANKIISIDIEKKDLELKVDGFIKQEYSIKIESKTGIIYKEFIETGRSESSIKEIVSQKIKEEIINEIGRIL